MLLQDRGTSACLAAACQGRAERCIAEHIPAPLWRLPRGAQGGPGPWTPPGPLWRVSQHRKRENTCQGACRDSVHLHLLFFPAVAKVAPPRPGPYGPNIALVLRKLFHFCLLSIKVPVPSPSLASPAVKAYASSPLLTSLALWLSCIHPSLHLPVPLFALLPILFCFTSPSSSSPLPVFCGQCHSPAPWAALQCLSFQHFHGLVSPLRWCRTEIKVTVVAGDRFSKWEQESGRGEGSHEVWE